MWFKLISLGLAALCLGKAAVALVAPQLFYRLRLAQYGSAQLPWTIFFAPLYVLTLAALAWYATLFNYTSWGWPLTLFLTLISALAVVNLLRWSRHRTAVATVIAKQPAERVRFDVGLGVLGGVLAPPDSCSGVGLWAVGRCAALDVQLRPRAAARPLQGHRQDAFVQRPRRRAHRPARDARQDRHVAQSKTGLPGGRCCRR